MPQMLMLSAADVHAVFDVSTAIDSQRAAFRSMGNGSARLAPRLLLDGPGDGSVAFCYAARMDSRSGAVSKFGSVTPANARRGLPGVSAIVVALDPDTGQPAAVVEGTSLTTLRTAAATAVAAEQLAAPDSGELTVFGCGVQGDAHVRALAEVLPLTRVQLWARDAARRTELAARLRRDLDLDVVAATSPETAVRSADVVVTCTTSPEPVFAGEWLQPGATVLSVGSFAADRCETDQTLIHRCATVVVDDVSTAAQQAGPIVVALRQRALALSDLVPLGDVVTGSHRGRRADDDIVYYNSVGIGVQDAAAAWAIVLAARADGRGRELAL